MALLEKRKLALRIASSVERKLAWAITQSHGSELCGLLLGARYPGKQIITNVVFSHSTVLAPDEFEISDHELRRLRAWAEDHQLEIQAVFHSHPSGDSRLSQTDRAVLRYSEWPWIIVTRAERPDTVVLTGYQAGSCAPVAIQLADGANPAGQPLKPRSAARRRPSG